MKGIRNTPRVASGGASAPRSAAGGHTTGLTNGPSYAGFALSPTQKNNIKHGQANKPKPAGDAAAQTPGSQPLDWNSPYEQAVGTAHRRFDNAITGLDYQKTAAEQDYGLSAGYNDYQSNPYSRAAQLEESYKRANRGSTNSYAAGGQLYAGSLSNALGANRSSYGQSHDALEKEYRNALQENNAKRLAAGDEQNEAIDNAAWNRIEGQAGEELDPTTAPAGGGSGTPAKTKIYKGKNGQRHGVGAAGLPTSGKKKKRK